MALRKELRKHNTIKQKEPNLLSYLDLVALGTVCDVVDLQKYNRLFVMKGLELIHQRHHKGISKLIDNSLCINDVIRELIVDITLPPEKKSVSSKSINHTNLLLFFFKYTRSGPNHRTYSTVG